MKNAKKGIKNLIINRKFSNSDKARILSRSIVITGCLIIGYNSIPKIYNNMVEEENNRRDNYYEDIINRGSYETVSTSFDVDGKESTAICGKSFDDDDNDLYIEEYKRIYETNEENKIIETNFAQRNRYYFEDASENNYEALKNEFVSDKALIDYDYDELETETVNISNASSDEVKNKIVYITTSKVKPYESRSPLGGTILQVMGYGLGLACITPLMYWALADSLKFVLDKTFPEEKGKVKTK